MLGLLIRYVSAPDAGREIEVDAATTEVTFGRNMDAVVGFPAELDIVGRDHFRLRREVGAWKFVISKQRPVFVDGRPLIDGEELDGPVEIQLSGPGGPRLRIEPRDPAAGNMLPTRVLAQGEDIGDVALSARRGGRRLSAWLAGVSALLALVAAGYFLLRQDVATVVERFPTLEEQVASAAASAASRLDSGAILARVRPSVYLVAIRTPTGTLRGMGTASVVRLPDGTKALATNGHISEPVREILAKGGASVDVVAVQPLGPDYPKLRVVRAVTHPAYLEFEKWALRLGALRLESRVRDVKVIPIGYDVGLLYVAEPDRLGEPLELASREEMEALDSGAPLAMTGYPMQELSGTDIERPEPNAHVGIVTAVTTFYLFRGAAADNLLIQHSLPTAGGASGSPIFNAKGLVVGYHNATNAPRGFPTSSMINYGQRADMLLDLMSGAADAKMPEYRRQWAAVEDKLTKSDPDAILNDLINEFIQDVGAVAREIRREPLEMSAPTADGPHARVGLARLQPEAGAAYLIFAYSDDRRPILLNAFGPGQTWISGGAGGYFISSLRIDNRNGDLGAVTIGALDQSSLGDSAVPVGKVTLAIWKAP